jgi:hypothetical protein
MMKTKLQFKTAWALKNPFSDGIVVTASLPHSSTLSFSYTLTSTHFYQCADPDP